MSDTGEERAEADPREEATEDVRLSAAGRTTPRPPPQTLTDLSAQWFPVAEGRPPTQVSCVGLPREQKKVQCLDLCLCHRWWQLPRPSLSAFQLLLASTFTVWLVTR